MREQSAMLPVGGVPAARAATTISYASTVLAGSPILYYRLGEAPGSSTVANIGSAGHAFDGAVQGNASLGQHGL